MGVLIKRTFRDKYLIILVYCLASFGLAWLYVSMFPTISAQYEAYSELTKAFPETLMKAFGIEDMDFSKFENFIAVEQFSFTWPLLAAFLAISLAGSAIADEIEKGTMALLLSLPISRTKLFMSRWVVGLITMALFVAFSVLAIIPLAKIYDVDIVAENYWRLSLICFLFSFAVYSLALLFSAIFSDRGKVYFMSGGLLVAMYVANLVASLKENLSDLKYVSLFYYFNATDALARNQIDSVTIFVFWGMAIVCLPLALIWFKRRDIAV